MCFYTCLFYECVCLRVCVGCALCMTATCRYDTNKEVVIFAFLCSVVFVCEFCIDDI